MMKSIVSHPIEKAAQAFTDHQLISVQKTNGQLIGPGYIMIMYGEVAFRMQVTDTNESYFIRMEEIDQIILR